MTPFLQTLASSLIVGPLQFDRPIWLWLIPIFGGIAVWIAMVNLSGLGAVTRWLALALRLLVITLLAAALAEPQWRREAKDVAVTFVLDTSASVPVSLQRDVEQFAKDARTSNKREGGDRLGYVTVAKDGYVQTLPSRATETLEHQHLGAVDGTNLESGMRLALALKPPDAAYRVVVASDANETSGSILAAAETAKSLGVPVDVIPLTFKHDEEVILDRLVVPSTAREGENVTARVVLNATKKTKGRLAILVNGEPMDLSGDGSKSAPVELDAGTNVKVLTLPAPHRGAMKFEAVYMPDAGHGGASIGDSVAENNRGAAVTFVGGEGRALVLTETSNEAAAMLAVLEASKIKADVSTVASGPQTLTDFNAYDVVILANLSSDLFTQQQQEDLKRYVYDSGGGLLVLGGPNSFGAGGWIGSPLEDALPVRLDPPQKRQMPKGALVLVIHSVEMPDGVFYGKKTAEAAVNALSRLDLIGINEFNGASSEWVHSLQPVGDGTRVKRAIQNLNFGDMPDFTPSLQLTYDALINCDAGQKHAIMISDGDPSLPPASLLDKFVAAKITISTVGVYPHSTGDTSRMETISKYTRGRHYHIDTEAGLAKIPQIFTKEAQTVKRSLIWEGTPFTPNLVGGVGDAMRGVTRVPRIQGYVVTAEREGLALVTLKGKEGDPILAQWQHGLGRVVAFTSDAATRWAPEWVQWDGFKAFWEQHVRWAMRPTGSANLRVTTETKGDATTVTVDALDTKGERLNFAKFRGRIAAPDGTSADVELKQVGPGKYQAVLPAAKPGSSVLSLRYAAPDPSATEGLIEGTVQAAVNRPFTDEFRTLQDNAALLERVAAMTGGRILGRDAAKADLWRREGVTMPVSTRAIWLGVAIAAMSLFLMDVGVRRVRIDIPAMAMAVKRAFGRGKQQAGAHVGGLKAAREQARQKIAAKEMSDAERAAQRAMQQAASSTAKTKFEATPEQLKRPQAPVALGGAEARPTETRPGIKDAKPAQGSPSEGLSRLKDAKRKAREEMDE